jgi:hypothetical protein
VIVEDETLRMTSSPDCAESGTKKAREMPHRAHCMLRFKLVVQVIVDETDFDLVIFTSPDSCPLLLLFPSGGGPWLKRRARQTTIEDGGQHFAPRDCSQFLPSCGFHMGSPIMAMTI